jgi:hypothetical protein
VKGDNEAMRSVFAEYGGYCSHLYSVAQFVHCEQGKHRIKLDSGDKK